MDGTRPSICRSAGQDARKIYRKSDGTFAVAVEFAPNVIEFGQLVLVPDRTTLDVYEDALGGPARPSGPASTRATLTRPWRLRGHSGRRV